METVLSLVELLLLFSVLTMILHIARVGNPVQVLADAAGAAIATYWRAFETKHEIRDTTERDSLNVAMAYFAHRTRALTEEAMRQRSSSSARAVLSRRQELTLRGVLEDLAWAYAVVWVPLTLAAVLGLPLYLLAQSFPSLLATAQHLVIVVLAALILYLVSGPWLYGSYELALATGTGVVWRNAQPQTRAAYEEQRERVFAMLGSPEPGQPPSKTKIDPDLPHADETPLPLIPGAADVILASNENALRSIRDHLYRVRRLHLWTSSLSFVMFLASVGVSVYAVIFLEHRSWQTLFGGVSLGTVVGSYSYLSLRSARTAQIALALFDSFVAEVRANLTEAEMLTAVDDRKEFRSKAWQQFRIGLNELWLTEGKQGVKEPAPRRSSARR